MNLKEQIFAEMALFFNSAEFAQEATIDGKRCLVVVDNDRLMQRSKSEYEGISCGELLFYIKAADLPRKPAPESAMRFDGKPMIVFDCREDEGIYEIILTHNRR